ncbi:MAG: UDP-N-acetylglucosamine--N-acetylmuramyl-(pentapeptide) pyrophosphoryl-undecaprenol N-acetylglucosamine transferase [Longimicrobiaceae bacterium]
MSARIIFAGGGTGGHLYPALALGEAVKRLDPDARVMYVGALRGVERRVLPERGVAHVLLPLEPIRRSRVWRNWRLPPSLVRSGAGLFRVFRRFRPGLVVGTGGYASGPAVGWALLNRVPTALQEQNSYPGLVTRWLSSRVGQLHLAFPEARDYLRPGRRTKVFEFGNPVQPPDFSLGKDEARGRFGLGSGPLCLVVGGSQGARAVNEALLSDLRGAVDGRLPPRPAGLELLWATGPAHFEAVSARLSELELGGWVHPLAYITDMPAALRVADLAVSRAGAMALAELCAWGVPGVLVPLPTAAANHQHHNAAALAAAGAAMLLPESELDPGALWEKISALAAAPEKRAQMSVSARERGTPAAADRIAAELLELAKGEG